MTNRALSADDDMLVPGAGAGSAPSGLVPNRDYGSDSSDEDLMPGAAVAPIPMQQAPRYFASAQPTRALLVKGVIQRRAARVRH